MMSGGPERQGSQTTPLLARARTIIPVIAEAAEEAEAGCELPQRLVEALHDSELFRMLLPRHLGGEETDPVTYLQVMANIAEADASTAWCIGQISGCSLAAAFLEPETAQAIWGSDRRAVLSWGAGLGGLARVDKDGGYRVTGKWAFSSGSKHATWLGGHCRVLDSNGLPVAGEHGKQIERTMIFPKNVAAVTANWRVIGLRGTGSDSYSVHDLFVPERFAFARDDARDRRYSAPLYYLSTTNIFAAGFATVAVGVARGALRAFQELAAAKKPQASVRKLSELSTIQARIGLTEANLRAAHCFLLEAVRGVWLAAERRLSPTLDQRMNLRMAATLAIHHATHAVDMAYHEAGATAIFDVNPFERRFRDMHTITQQIQAHPVHFETVGAHLLGLQPDLRYV